MIHKIEEKDRESFLSLTRAFYASPVVLHPVPEEYHIAVFEEMMRSDVYAEGYLFEYGGAPAGYALLAKTFSHEAGGLVIWIEEIYTVPAFRGKGLGREFFAFLDREYGSTAKRCVWRRSRATKERRRCTAVSALIRSNIGNFTKNHKNKAKRKCDKW